MEDIHTPAIAATALPTPSTSIPTNTAELLALMAEKDLVEAELKALGAVLDSHKVNMKTSLTSFDGYPRDDIDVPQIRITRTRIICLRNDYKDLMKRIELGLHAVHAAAAAAPPPPPSTSPSPDVDTPFAKINSVAANSPASDAGLHKGDYIKRFGHVHALNHDHLRKLGEEVKHHENRPISVLLSRKDPEGGADLELELELVPRLWAGAGMLGCHILPL